VPSDQLAALISKSGAPVARSGQGQPQMATEKLSDARAKPTDSASNVVEPSGNSSATDTQKFGRRIALVLGNSSYKNVSALPNPARDAATVAKTFEAVGFQSVTLKTNLGREQLLDALRNFAKQAKMLTGPLSITQAMASKLLA
jgi:uncharacterized protein with beta-barrel porin domain